MSNQQDPFSILRKLASRSEPTEEQRATALERLQEAMAQETAMPRIRPGARMWRPVVAVAAAAALVVVAVPLLMNGPAQAALGEIARAARQATPTDMPDGHLIYTRSEGVNLTIVEGSELGVESEFAAYLLPREREVWHSPSERFLTIRTTIGTPQFFNPVTEAAYYRSGHDQVDRVGDTIVEQLADVDDPIANRDWPTESDALRNELEQAIIETGDEPTPHRILELATNLLRERDPTPAFRSSIFSVLAELPLQLEAETEGSISVRYEDDDWATTITFGRDATLIDERIVLTSADTEAGIPANTTISDVTYTKPVVVDSLPSDLRR